MPKTFDERLAARKAADRTFILRGVQFTRRPSVSPDEFDEADKAREEAQEDGDEEKWTNALDRMILVYLDGEDAEENWRKVRAIRGEDAVTIADMEDIARWLVEEDTGRPTQAPEASTGGRVSTIRGSEVRRS